MVRKNFLKVTMAMVFLPTLVMAQSVSNGAPLGSKENPIKGTLVSTSAPVSHKGTGKRGSKTNPIIGSTHPRGSDS